MISSMDYTDILQTDISSSLPFQVSVKYAHSLVMTCSGEKKATSSECFAEREDCKRLLLL